MPKFVRASWITRILSLIAFLVVARVAYGVIVDYLGLYDCGQRGGNYVDGRCDAAGMRRE